MQTVINQHKLVILFVAVIAFSQSAMSQSEMRARHSAMVNQGMNSGNFPTFDAEITTDSSDTKFILTVENPGKAKLMIRVFSHIYGEVYRTDINDALYRNRFDLGNVEDGAYLIEISSGKEKIRRRVKINTITQINRKIDIS